MISSKCLVYYIILVDANAVLSTQVCIYFVLILEKELILYLWQTHSGRTKVVSIC
jgi:hypothetical protein